MILCVDFDGTCVTHAYPKIGNEIGAAEVLQEVARNGHKIILYTMRSLSPNNSTNTLGDAIDWFKKHNIPLFGVNKNPEQSSWTLSPKPYAHLYIDDAGAGCPLLQSNDRPYVDWISIIPILWKEGFLQDEQVVYLRNTLYRKYRNS